MENASSSFRLALILGGARSGKSRYGLGLAARCPAPRLFVATGEPRDAEMEARIEAHQRERGSDWATREVPLELAAALNDAQGPLRGHRGGLPHHVGVQSLAAGGRLPRAASRRPARICFRPWPRPPPPPSWSAMRWAGGLCRTIPWPGSFGIRPAGCTSDWPRWRTWWSWWWRGSRCSSRATFSREGREPDCQVQASVLEKVLVALGALPALWRHGLKPAPTPAIPCLYGWAKSPCVTAYC